jgi:hypothetical protein
LLLEYSPDVQNWNLINIQESLEEIKESFIFIQISLEELYISAVRLNFLSSPEKRGYGNLGSL